jgi:hypothetical protein
VDHRAIVLVAGLCLAVTIVFGQQSDGSRIFTPEQAVAGRVAYEKSCGRRHTLTLMGRQGNPDERLTIESFSRTSWLRCGSEVYRGLNNRVPPLAGKVFLQRWGSKNRGPTGGPFSGG